MCTVLLPPGVNPIPVNKYININISIFTTQNCFTSQWITLYFRSNYFEIKMAQKVCYDLRVLKVLIQWCRVILRIEFVAMYQTESNCQEPVLPGFHSQFLNCIVFPSRIQNTVHMDAYPVLCICVHTKIALSSARFRANSCTVPLIKYIFSALYWALVFECLVYNLRSTMEFDGKYSLHDKYDRFETR
jgi:hypothetical protein